MSLVILFVFLFLLFCQQNSTLSLKLYIVSKAAEQEWTVYHRI